MRKYAQLQDVINSLCIQKTALDQTEDLRLGESDENVSLYNLES